jgi:Zn-dependent peptidase ImmA (M78 family)/DNA-binding XRE family transcriptional regulator
VEQRFCRSRLTVARLRRGLTRKALAAAAKVSEKSLYGYEKGANPPSESTVATLAQALRFPVGFFYRRELELVSSDGASFRALSKTRASQRDRALAGGSLAIELNDWIDARFELPQPDVPNLRHEEDPEAAALALRAHWGLGDGPISNMVHLLESKGVRVYSLAEACEEVDAFALWRGEQPFIFLNTLKSGEHSRFDAAHELAHLVLHRHGTPSGQQAEHEATHFASAFLLPRTGVMGSIHKNPTLDYLIQAKIAWGISVAAFAHRLNDIGMLTDWYYKSLSIEIQRRHYRRREPLPGKRELSQVLEKVFVSLRQEGVRRSDVAAQLDWPLEELNALIFQLVLSGIKGDKSMVKPSAPSSGPSLKLWKAKG